MSDSDLRYLKHAEKFPLPAGEQLIGVFKAGLDTFTPRRVPRRLRRRLRENEPHRASNPGAGDVIASNLLGLVNLPARLVTGLLKGIFFAPFYGIARQVHGKAWEGGWESEAGRFLMRILAGNRREDFDNHGCLLVFTDHRLLVLDDPTSPELNEPFLLTELPRDSYALRQEPHPARHKRRFDLAFPDGSWVALADGDVNAKRKPEIERLLRG